MKTVGQLIFEDNINAQVKEVKNRGAAPPILSINVRTPGGDEMQANLMKQLEEWKKFYGLEGETRHE